MKQIFVAIVMLFTSMHVWAEDTVCDSCIPYMYLEKQSDVGKGIATGGILFVLLGPIGILGVLNNTKWVSNSVCINEKRKDWFAAYDANTNSGVYKYASIADSLVYNQFKTKNALCVKKP
jgi:hypothetical protein